MPRPTAIGMMGGDEPSRFSSFHSSRNEPQGIIATYIHPGGRVGALVELSCDTDFVARTEEFRTLGREIAMQVAAMDPSTVGSMDSPADDPGALLDQEYIRDSSKTIRDLVNETIAKVREHIWVTRFVRFEVGER